MELEPALTWGAVAAIWEDPAVAAAAGLQPVLQVIDVAELGAPEMTRVVLSDGAGLEPPITMSTAFRAGRIRRGAVVRVLEFTRLAVGSERIIIVQKLEVLQTDCMMVGSPTRYPFISLEELDAESVGSSTELNYGAYSAVQGLKGNLTRGMLALLQQPVMQMVGVSLISSELKKFEMYHLVLSDGVHKQDATLAFHLNHLIKNTHLRKGTIVRLLKFMCNTFQGPRFNVSFRSLLVQSIKIMLVPNGFGDALSNKLFEMLFPALLVILNHWVDL